MIKNKITNYDKFPTTTKNIFINDLWLAKFPYKEKGSMEKLRPVLIAKVENNEVIVRMITSNKNKGIKINNNKYFKFDSYLTNNYATVTFDKLYRKIGRLKAHLQNKR